MTTQKRKGKSNTISGEKAVKNFQMKRLGEKKVSIRRVIDDKYGRTAGESGLNRENIKELLLIEGHFMVYMNRIYVP